MSAIRYNGKNVKTPLRAEQQEDEEEEVVDGMGEPVQVGLVWFLPPISCLSQAANPGCRFSRPGVTIAAWIRTRF